MQPDIHDLLEARGDALYMYNGRGDAEKMWDDRAGTLSDARKFCRRAILQHWDAVINDTESPVKQVEKLVAIDLTERAKKRALFMFSEEGERLAIQYSEDIDAYARWFREAVKRWVKRQRDRLEGSGDGGESN